MKDSSKGKKKTLNNPTMKTREKKAQFEIKIKPKQTKMSTNTSRSDLLLQHINTYSLYSY